MASAEREPIMGVWGSAPSGVQGRASGQGVRGLRPLKLKAFCRLTTQTRGKICHFSLVFLKLSSKLQK